MGFEILSIGSAAREITSNGPLDILQLGQRAHLQGRSGIYVIVGLDLNRRTADLIASAGITPVIRQIPFELIRPAVISAMEESRDRLLPFPS